MRLAIIITATAIMALGAGSASAQSPNPAKREQWAKSMSRCLEDVDDRENHNPEMLAKVCKSFADQEIEDSYQNRLRALLASKEVLSAPPTEVIMKHRALHNDFEGSIFRGQLKWLEAHIRHTVIEECLVDPAGLSRDDCNRIGGLDVIREITKADEDMAADESEGEDVH